MATVCDYPNFNSQDDAEQIRKAMKGAGTDEGIITHIIGTRSNKQRQAIKTDFKTLFGLDLLDELKSELSSNYQETVLALMEKPDEFDAHQIHKAMSGAGTDERALIEIICSRDNNEIKQLKEAYKKLYKKDLESAIKGDTSGHFQRLLVSLLQGARKEDEGPNMESASADARALLEAGEAQWGTDESRFNAILASRSFPQLQLIFREYEKVSNKTLEKAIKSEFSGDIEDGLLAIVRCSEDRSKFFAERLYKSMKGLGTDDRTLIRIMASRSEKDMVQIKSHFQAMYGKSLASFISGDCSGDYKKLLLVVCGQ